MNAVLHSTGISKADQAFNAVLAHPGLTSLTILDYVPGLGPQVKAAGILHELFMNGRIERRSGKELWEWWPKAGAMPVRGQEIVEEEAELEPMARADHTHLGRPPRGKRAKKGFRVVDRLAALAIQNPGNDAKALAGLMVPPVKYDAAASLLRQAIQEKLLSRALRGGVWRYYALGEVPADEVAAPEPAPAAPEPRGKATTAEVERAGIAAQATLAKAAATPESPPPAPVAGPRTIAGFVIEAKPLTPPVRDLRSRVQEAMDAIAVGESFVVDEGSKRGRETAFCVLRARFAVKKFTSENDGAGLRIGRTE